MGLPGPLPPRTQLSRGPGFVPSPACRPCCCRWLHRLSPGPPDKQVSGQAAEQSLWGRAESRREGAGRGGGGSLGRPWL